MSRFAKTVFSTAVLCLPMFATPLVFAEAPASPAGTDVKPNAKANNAPRRALDRAMPEVKFTGNTLSDVLDFLGDASGGNLNVDWKALDEAHVAKDTPITLRMSANVPLRKVLKLVLQQAAGAGALTFFVDDGVIEITTQEASDKQLMSKTYPIQDLLFQPGDYANAPDLSLQAAQGQSGGGGGGGGGGGSSNQQQLFGQGGSNSNSSGANTGNTQQARADEIIKLITDTVKPELWQVNGGTATISFYRGNLIVNAPRSIHEMLQSN